MIIEPVTGHCSISSALAPPAQIFLNYFLFEILTQKYTLFICSIHSLNIWILFYFVFISLCIYI